MKVNIKIFLVICLILILLALIGLGIWKLVKTEDYVSFREIGRFPHRGYIYYGENDNTIVKENDKNDEYDKRMRYLRAEEQEKGQHMSLRMFNPS